MQCDQQRSCSICNQCHDHNKLTFTFLTAVLAPPRRDPRCLRQRPEEGHRSRDRPPAPRLLQGPRQGPHPRDPHCRQGEMGKPAGGEEDHRGRWRCPAGSVNGWGCLCRWLVGWLNECGGAANDFLLPTNQGNYGKRNGIPSKNDLGSALFVTPRDTYTT